MTQQSSVAATLLGGAGHDIPDTTVYHDGAVRVGDGRLVLLVDSVHGDLRRHGTSAKTVRGSPVAYA